MDIEIDIEIIELVNYCKNGNLELVKNYLQNNPNVNISHRSPFPIACFYGHLHVAQWLLSRYPDINICAINDGIFRNTCYFGKLHVAEWLLSIKPDIDISALNEDAFRYACYHGHLHIAQWLLSVKPTINISAKDEFAFTGACYNGHLHVAQWLLTLKPNFIISAGFLFACEGSHLNVALWLLCVCVKPDSDLTEAIDEATDEAKIYFAKSFLLYCFHHKNINALLF